MRWADKIEELREVERRSGRTPKPLKDMPALLPCNADYYAAFVDLSKARPITYEGIHAYASITGLNALELMVKVHAIEDAINEAHRDGNDGS